jgi:uncharacterized membrane protein YesL
MRIFSPNFVREGPGIEKNDPQKKGISLFFQLFIARFWDILKLNILFIIYSIPIITIGPAFGAMTAITMSMVQNKHIFIFSDFHEEFKANWKQSLTCGFISCIVFIFLNISLLFYFKLAQNNTLFYIVLFFSIFITVLFGLAWLYIYPLLTTVCLSLQDIFKNAILLSIVCFKNSLLGALIYGTILGLNVFLFPLSLPLILILTFSLLSFISSFSTWSGIKKYIIK